MKEAKIKCVAPWAGGKRTLAPRIVELLGPHDAYYEPFVGGCAILPQKSKGAMDHINDANPKIVGVLRAIRDRGEDVRRILSPLSFHEEHYEYADKVISGNALGAFCRPCDWEAVAVPAWQLVKWWMGPSGLAGTTQKGWFADRKTNSGGSPSVRWESFKASIPALSDRLHGTVIMGVDFRVVLEIARDRDGTAFYVDPPYFTKEFKYEHDFKPKDHEDLAAILNSLTETRIVVSYRDEIEGGLLGGGSLLDQLYPPAKWRRIEVGMNKNMASASGTAKRNTEVLLVNETA